MVRRIRRTWRYYPPLLRVVFALHPQGDLRDVGADSPAVGDRVAKYAGENVHQIVRKQAAFEKGDYVKALQDGFVATDTALMDGIFLSHTIFMSDLYVRETNLDLDRSELRG